MLLKKPHERNNGKEKVNKPSRHMCLMGFRASFDLAVGHKIGTPTGTLVNGKMTKTCGPLMV